MVLADHGGDLRAVAGMRVADRSENKTKRKQFATDFADYTNQFSLIRFLSVLPRGQDFPELAL